MPILDKFGDLEVDENLEVLIDHVCTFVERNQVTWNDVHDRPIKFDRVRAADRAADKIASMARGLAEGEPLKPIYFLLSGAGRQIELSSGIPEHAHAHAAASCPLAPPRPSTSPPPPRLRPRPTSPPASQLPCSPTPLPPSAALPLAPSLYACYPGPLRWPRPRSTCGSL